MRTTETEHLTFTLRVVRSRTVEHDDGFDDDELPSLPGMRVYDTTGEEVTETRGPSLVKCGARRLEARKKAAR